MKVLIATDGSEYSREAVEKYCQLLNGESRVEIKVISAVERMKPISAEPFGASNEHYAHIEAELVDQAKEFVAAAELIIKDRVAGGGVSVQTEVFVGSVKKTIIDEAEQFGADLIVLGSHGYGFMKRVLLGSVSDFVVHHAPCSVLIVRPESTIDE